MLQQISALNANDLPFLYLAMAGKADFMIGGDGDLLGLADQFICPIVALDEFIKRFSL